MFQFPRFIQGMSWAAGLWIAFWVIAREQLLCVLQYSSQLSAVSISPYPISQSSHW